MGAVESAIAESQHWFIGEDRTFVYAVTDSAGAAQNMTGWSLTWELLDRRGGTVVLTKSTSGSGITLGNGAGTNDYATVTIADTDTEALTGGPGTYHTVLRRTDAGSEVVLAFGDAVLQEASI